MGAVGVVGGLMMRIETKRLYLRPMTDDDFDLMSRIWMDWVPMPLRDNKKACEELFGGLWETTQDPTVLSYMIFLRDGDRFCGRVNMQKTDEEIPELGIDLLVEYQNQGYGPEAIAAFANWYGESRHISEIKVLITVVNTRSAHVFQKLGAEYIRDDPSFLKVAENLAKDLPEKREAIMRDLCVREYLLKLPITGGSDTAP